MNPYDHEDAFKAANLHAGNVVNLSDALQFNTDKDMARALIFEAQKQYEELFNAFIAGVDYGRKNPRDKSAEETK